MDIIKERVTQVLDSKGVLTRLKAELRANVFLAINDQDIQNGGVGLASKSDGRHREQLLRDPAGVVLVELVRDFLRWSNLQFTSQVFEPEMQLATPPWDRSSLEQHVGLAGGDASAPLLLQLLNHHMGQQQASLPAYMAAQQAAAAAAPDYRRSSNADLAVQQQLQPQTAGYAAAAAAKQRASKSGSYVDDEEEDLLAAGMLHGGQSHEEEEYAAVFVAAQARSGGSGTESDGGSSSSSGRHQVQQQQSRPVRGAYDSMDAALPQQQVPQPGAAGELSESFGHLDRSPAAMSLELHGLDSPPAQYTAAAAAGVAEASSPGSDAAGSSGLSSPSASMEQQQGSIASPPVASMPGRLGPLAALRPSKLAPLPAVKGPAGVSSSSRSPGAPDDLREELRRVGLLGASAADASPGASSNGSPVYGAAQQHALYYGSGHDLESPGSSMAASAINTREVPAVTAAAGGVGSAGLSMAAGVYGSAAVGVDFGSDDSSDDDDFGIAEQWQLFEAARRQLSQSSQGGGLQVPQQQQQQQRPSAATAAAQWEDDDGDSVSDVDIPEDLSVPLEGLDAGDYSEVFRAGAGAEQPQQQAGVQSAAAAAAREQHGLSMDLHETGLSVSDRPGGIGLESADFRIDDDDF